MVDIGVAPGSSNVARIEVLPTHPQTLVIIGADTGSPNGPSRKVDIYEDVHVRGNLLVGELNCIRLRLQQGIDGVINDAAGIDDEVPRIEKLAGEPWMHIIGGGPLHGPNRKVVLHDNCTVSQDLIVNNDMRVLGDLYTNGGCTVGVDLFVNGEGTSTFRGSIDVAEGITADTIKASNVIIAAATFHFYNREGSVVCRMIRGSFGFDSAVWSTNTNSPWDELGPVSMLFLDEAVKDPVITITPWIVGVYNEENSDGLPEMLLGPDLDMEETPRPLITVKGEEVVGENGTLPSTTGNVQQIEIKWVNGSGSFEPIQNADDLVFDIKVMGASAISVADD